MKFAATVVGTGVIAAASLTAHAGAPIAWNNALGGEWRIATNWDPMAVPGLSDGVLLGLSGAYTVRVSGADAAAANLTMSNADATLVITPARILTLGQSFHNLGVLTINPTASISTTQVRLTDGMILTGTGRIVLNAPGVRSWISPLTPGATFTQSAGHTIQGEGQISTGMTNNGLVLADVPGGELILNTNPKTNNAQMAAVSGGKLRIQASTVDQSPTAVISADGAGSTVELVGVTINGGTIQTSADGLISVSGDSAISNLALAGNSQITGARILNATGDISHTGHMIVNPAVSSSTTSLRITDGTAFSGNGLITLNAPASRAQISPATVLASFTQSAGHTIEGHGQITAGMTNNGLVVANDDGLELNLSSSPKANNAQMRAEGGGVLLFSGQTITQSPTATITADGAGSTVKLAGVTINGGTIQTFNDGLVSVFGGDSTISDLALAGNSEITTARTLNAAGDITHTGHMVVNPAISASTTSLRVAQGAAFSGSGLITLNAPGLRAQIVPATPGASFTQAAGHTIEGHGQITAGMTNNGLVLANDNGLELILSSSPKANNAQMRAVGGATLHFQGSTITQSATGTITADGAGSTVQLAGVTIGGGTIQTTNGGLISVFGGDSTISNLTLAGNSQITAARVLDASGTIVHTGNMIVNPAASASTTTLRIADGTAFTGDGTITLNAPGALARIIPATLGAVLTIGPGHTIGGIGQIATAMSLEGTIAPGLSVSTMTASQPVTMAATAVFEAEVAGSGNADQISSTSSFQADGTLNVTFVDAFNPPLTWNAVLVNATQGVSGAFHTINAPQPTDPRLEFRVIYRPSEIRIGAFCKPDTNADGLLNFFDITTYIASFNAGDPDADIAAPFGTLNFFDLLGYIARYNAGCP